MYSKGQTSDWPRVSTASKLTNQLGENTFSLLPRASEVQKGYRGW